MNLAATWRLPVVFVCENNQFALSADWRTLRAVEDLADRAAGYGMHGEVVDGNDVLAVEDAVARALAAAEAGDGPSFLEMKTFRRMQHSMRANLPDVRDPAVLDEWEPKDPLPRYEKALREAGALDDERVAAIRTEVEAEVEAAIAVALADEDASTEDLLPSVFVVHRTYPQPPSEGERDLGFVAAIREALDQELEADPDVIVMGEDIGRVGGLFRATEGLYERYGAERIRDTPTERVRAAASARPAGQPAVGSQFSDFAGVAFDQIMTGREAPLHDGRHRGHAARAADGVGRWRPARCAALPEPRGALRPHPRAGRGDAVEPVRRQGPSLRRDPGRQPGDLPGAEAPLLRRPGARARGALRGGAGTARIAPGSDVTVVALGAAVPTRCGSRASSSARG
jgi:hypothetical protein